MGGVLKRSECVDYVPAYHRSYCCWCRDCDDDDASAQRP